MAELACDDEGLHSGMSSTKTTLHIAFQEVTVLFHVTKLDRIGNLSCSIFICVDHFRSFSLLTHVIELNLSDFIKLILLLLFKFLLHFDLEASHVALLELSRVQFADETRITSIHALYAEDHEHVYLCCFGYIVVR